MSVPSYLDVLNPEQLQAVEHEGSPLLILAGAGSGKTRVITTKIAYLIQQKNIDPYSILAVTFTKKAATEMKERAVRLDERASGAQIRTFHSFGSWFLRVHANAAPLAPSFTVYDDDDSVTLLSKACPNLTRVQVSAAVRKISRAKDYCLDCEDPGLDLIDSDPEFRQLYRAYQKRLRETGNADFGDLIMLPVKMLQQNPQIKQRIHQRFSVIMVDEYQDSNAAQFQLLTELSGPETYICVVGDDDQSIYKFRGAEIQNILTFEYHFPGTQIIRLERNYRSVAPILSVADQVVSCNKDRLGKTLRAERKGGEKPTLLFLQTQDDEAAFCAEQIIRTRKLGVDYSDWAILYRTNAQSLGFESEFLRRKIPYRVVGSLKFYEREEIKDVLAFLSLVVNPKNEIAFRRIVNKPARGIGEVSQDKIVDLARKNHYEQTSGFFDGDGGGLLDACREILPQMSKKAQEGLRSFIHILEKMIEAVPSRQVEQSEQGDHFDSNDVKNSHTSPDNLSVFIEELVKQSQLVEYHTVQDEIAGTQRVANMQELINSAILYPNTRDGLLQFLDHIELDRAVETNEDSPDSVTLITLHNTKGLEFARVIITGIEQGIFPRDGEDPEELEEERRLFYVGITRAKDQLYLTSCAQRRLYGKTAWMSPSPFLTEIDTANLQLAGRVPPSFGRLARSAYASPKWSASSPFSPRVEDPIARRWKLGKEVFHDDLGYGVISKTAWHDEDYVITISFEGGQSKQFMPKFQAKLLMLINDESGE